MSKASLLAQLAAFAILAPSHLHGNGFLMRSEVSTDDLDIRTGAIELDWSRNIGAGQMRLGLTAVGWSGPELSGVAASERLDLGLRTEGSRTLGNVDFSLEANLAAVDRLESWGLLGSATWRFAPGWSLEFSPSSQELAGWMSQGVRAHALATHLDWSGALAWAGAGARLEERSGGQSPSGAREIQLPDNRIFTAWAWGARTVAEGVVLGLSGSWADASEWTRQATGMRNDTLLWLDVPYRSPHEEASLDAVVKLRRWQGKLEASWPLWSTSRMRVESPWIADSPWSYRLDHVGLAELKLGWDLRMGSAVMGLESFVRSRPYVPAAWFTDRAWNQFGLVVTTAWSNPSKENLP